jgi:hypothetical protein
MEFDFSKMTTCDEPFYGVVPGKAAYPIGRVCHPDTFGTEETFRTEYLTFEVANFRSSYHAIFGRPMLVKFMAIPHHSYLIMKMPTPNGILSVLGDTMVFYNCESATVKLSKDSAIKAAVTVMVAQAAKIDQTTLQVLEQKLSYGPPWAHYLGGYQDRLLGGPLGLPGLRYTASEGVEHKDYTGVVLG